MTDIVEELRSIDTGLISVDAMYRAQQIARRAADEIERLRPLNIHNQTEPRDG